MIEPEIRQETTRRLREAVRVHLHGVVGAELQTARVLSWEAAAGLNVWDELLIRFGTEADVTTSEEPPGPPGTGEFAFWVADAASSRRVMTVPLGRRAEASGLESVLWDWLDARVAWAANVANWADVDERRRDEDAGPFLMREMLGDVLLPAISDLRIPPQDDTDAQVWLFFVSDGTAHGWAHRWTAAHNPAAVLEPCAEDLAESSWEAAADHDGDDAGGTLGPTGWVPRSSGAGSDQ